MVHQKSVNLLQSHIHSLYKQSTFARGMELHAKVTLFGEGCHGSGQTTGKEI